VEVAERGRVGVGSGDDDKVAELINVARERASKRWFKDPSYQFFYICGIGDKLIWQIAHAADPNVAVLAMDFLEAIILAPWWRRAWVNFSNFNSRLSKAKFLTFRSYKNTWSLVKPACSLGRAHYPRMNSRSI
jgi:hypothetical protein